MRAAMCTSQRPAWPPSFVCWQIPVEGQVEEGNDAHSHWELDRWEEHEKWNKSHDNIHIRDDMLQVYLDTPTTVPTPFQERTE